VVDIRIFLNTVRLDSPYTNNPDLDDFVDHEKLMQGIAHEIGHGVGLDDVETGGVCPAPDWTVMVTHYFHQSNGADAYACAWQNIPHVFRPVELQMFLLRPPPQP
jgi:hypothetical protein